jgi:hypothetical protein
VCWQLKADVFRGDGGARPGGRYGERVLAPGMDGMGASFSWLAWRNTKWKLGCIEEDGETEQEGYKDCLGVINVGIHVFLGLGILFSREACSARYVISC